MEGEEKGKRRRRRKKHPKITFWLQPWFYTCIDIIYRVANQQIFTVRCRLRRNNHSLPIAPASKWATTVSSPSSHTARNSTDDSFHQRHNQPFTQHAFVYCKFRHVTPKLGFWLILQTFLYITVYKQFTSSAVSTSTSHFPYFAC